MATSCTAPAPPRAHRAPTHPSAAPFPVSTSAYSPPSNPESTAPACGPLQVEPPPLITSTIDTEVPGIVDPGGAMEPFYERMACLLRGTAKDHVRIAVYGDSNMTMDWITGEMRRTLQERYGDGGHGYIALARPWRWYKHMDVRSGQLEKDWTAFAVSTHPAQDHCYGFAGIAARSERQGATTWVETAQEPSPVGTRASRFELYYLRKPGGGDFEIRLDGHTVETVRTDNPGVAAGFHAFSAPDGPHRVEIIALTPSPVVLFGITLERSAPSVVIDSLGVGAVSGPLLLRQDPAVMKASLERRGYDLVILLLGSNQVWPVMYERWMAELVDRFRQALPHAAVLIMTPVDQVESPTATRSAPNLALVARQNRQIAIDNRIAFWDFRGAMGGDAAIVKFMATGMGQADGIHLTPKGAAYMGRRMVYAIWRDLNRYLQAHPSAGCDGDGAEAH